MFKTFNHSHSEDKIKLELQSHDETISLFCQNFGDNKIGLFHHTKVIGGNLYSTKKEISFIQGIKGTCIEIPDFDVLVSMPNKNGIPVPSQKKLFDISNKKELENADVSSSNYNPRNFIPVPPFMIDPINDSISESDGNLSDVFLAALNSIKDFDTIHADDKEYIDKAKTYGKKLLF